MFPSVRGSCCLARCLAPKLGYGVHGMHWDQAHNGQIRAIRTVQFALVAITNQMLYQLSYASILDRAMRRAIFTRNSSIEETCASPRMKPTTSHWSAPYSKVAPPTSHTY